MDKNTVLSIINAYQDSTRPSLRRFFYIRLLGMLREDLLKHMSPLEWEHINFLGEYRVDPKGITTLESLRQLNQG